MNEFGNEFARAVQLSHCHGIHGHLNITVREKNRVFVNVNSNTYAFLTMTSQNVCSEYLLIIRKHTAEADGNVVSSAGI